MERSCSNRKRNKIPSATANFTSDKSVKNDNAISKRKPLSDLTNNFNLIPIQTLRKLCSNSIPTSQTQSQSLLNKSQTPFLPTPKKCPNSGPSKPYCDTRSGTSIGSSNFNNDLNSKPQTPTPVRHQLPRTSSTNPGEEGSELVVYSRKRTVENLKGQRKADVLPKSSTPVKKRKNEAKAISVPSSSSPAQNANDKGKAVDVPFSPTPVVKTKDKGKAIVMPFNYPHEEMEDKGKSTALVIHTPPTKKRKEKKKADAMVLSCPPLLRIRNIGNELDQAGDKKPSKSWTGPEPKCKKRRCSQDKSNSGYSLPQDYIRQQKAYFEEVDAFELPVEEVSYDELD